ncbi:MAG: LuxR C-terminal-related transcriptional regulator [Alistipes sp.]|nr:LuxR C-terminal-related transcriptional regulator [Alistipes sp.]
MNSLLRNILLGLLLLPAFAAAEVTAPDSGQLRGAVQRTRVRNLEARDYLGDVQVWDLTADGDGRVFAATGAGLSVWDGVRWGLYETPGTPILRCLAYDPASRRIYAGGDNEAGYFTKDARGGYTYICLYRNPRDEVPEIFWRIVLQDGTGYFQTHERIYRCDLRSGRMEPAVKEGAVGYIHAVGDSVWFQDGPELYALGPDGTAPTGITLSDRVIAVYPEAGRHILVTEGSGIFSWDGHALLPADPQLNARLAQVRLFAAARTADGRYLLGSVMDGLYVVDGEWRIRSHFGSQEGLQHTTVLSVEETPAGDVWLGLDGGMARIEASGAGVVVTSRSQEIGSVYDVAEYDGTLYAGTNKGLFRYDGNGDFQLVKGTQGQVWRLIDAGGTLVVSHDAGTFTLREGTLVRNEGCNIWQLLPWTDGKHWLGADFEGGFTLYEVRGGRLLPRKKIEGYNGVHSDMGIDRFGNVWVQNRSGDAVRIRIGSDGRTADTGTYSPGGKPAEPLYRARLDNDIYFFRGREVFGYDIHRDSLVRNDYYTGMLGVVRDAPTALTQSGECVFAIWPDGVGAIGRRGNRFFDYGRLNMPEGLNMIPSHARRIIPLGTHTIAVGLQNGVFFHDMRVQEAEYGNPRALRLERLLLHLRDSSVFLPVTPVTPDKEPYAVPQNYTSVEIRLSTLYTHGQVRYAIDGGEWTTASGVPALRINELQSGRHTLLIRNLDPVNPPQEPLELVFDVAYPWYLQGRFIVGMLLAALLLGLAVRFLFKRGVERQRRALLREQERLLEREKKEHDIELLRVELRERERKLINLTMMGIQRNTMLGELRREVELFPEEERRRRVLRKIDSYMNDKENHELFEKYFNTIHDGFFTRLLQRHPGLTPNEMRICAYIKLNLNTKEIAAYMNISPSSVEIARHRLRRKMELASEVNLQHYVSAI